MDITLKINDNVAAEAVDAFSTQFGYEAYNAQTPISKGAFAKMKLAEYIKAVIKQNRDQAAIAAMQATNLANHEEVNGFDIT